MVKPVTLHDGRVVDSSSEDWRHECEARWILDKLPSRDARRCYLRGWQDPDTGRQRKGVLQLRGEDEVKRLEATMWALWHARKKSA